MAEHVDVPNTNKAFVPLGKYYISKLINGPKYRY
jgi:hypothetical protein